MSVSLDTGYLFRATHHRGYILETPFVGSTVVNRLKKHLNDAGISEGETMHSFCSGCSITLAALGSQYEDIARHVGWRSIKTALHYTQFEKVCSQNDVSSLPILLAQRKKLDITFKEKPAFTAGKSFFLRTRYLKNTFSRDFKYYNSDERKICLLVQ